MALLYSFCLPDFIAVNMASYLTIGYLNKFILWYVSATGSFGEVWGGLTNKMLSAIVRFVLATQCSMLSLYYFI